MSEILENNLASKKRGRKHGWKDPNAACNNIELKRKQKLNANVRFKESPSYIKTKIKMNCKKYNLDVPILQDKSVEELNRILFEIKLEIFHKKN